MDKSVFWIVFNFVLSPVVVLFCIISVIAWWFSKSEKWSRDFQYLIHAMLISKLGMLVTNLSYQIVQTEHSDLIAEFINVEKVLVFLFDMGVMVSMWYVALFCKSVSNSTFVGPKRIPFHILAVASSVVVASSDSYMHGFESRVYTDYTPEKYSEFDNEAQLNNDPAKILFGYLFISVTSVVIVSAR